MLQLVVQAQLTRVRHQDCRQYASPPSTLHNYNPFHHHLSTVFEDDQAEGLRGIARRTHKADDAAADMHVIVGMSGTVKDGET
jgi:hypothetical protein